MSPCSLTTPDNLRVIVTCHDRFHTFLRNMMDFRVWLPRRWRPRIFLVGIVDDECIVGAGGHVEAAPVGSDAGAIAEIVFQTVSV